MKLTVKEVIPEGTVSIGIGVDENGKRWRFAGDWRPMREIAEAIEAGEAPEVDVEDYQILGPA